MTDWKPGVETWCKGMGDLIRWCRDEVPEDPRATAGPQFHHWPRVVWAQVEHISSGFEFRVAWLFLTAWETPSTRAHLKGLASWRNVTPGGTVNQSAPDVDVEVEVLRVPPGDPPKYRLNLVGSEDPFGVEPQYAHVDPLPDLQRWPTDTTKPWEGLQLVLNDGTSPKYWELQFAPAYFVLD
jgi:hypothetical protein